MLTLGNEELEEAPSVGDFILCTSCGERHRVNCSSSVKGNENCKTTLQTYKCGGKTYLVGVDRKDVRKEQNRNGKTHSR